MKVLHLVSFHGNKETKEEQKLLNFKCLTLEISFFLKGSCKVEARDSLYQYEAVVCEKYTFGYNNEFTGQECRHIISSILIKKELLIVAGNI